MDVEKFFHMTQGIGENSYAKNSSFQKRGSDMVKHITLESLQQVYLQLCPKSIGIADLGCSSGPNALSVIKDAVEAIDGVMMSSEAMSSEFRVYLNDLPTNDFNSIFKSLPDLYTDLRKDRHGGGGFPSLFIAGYPGSFYGRLFPNNCLHFVYSSYSLHWLSKVPPALYDNQGKPINKGSIYICESSPPLVSQAYFAQFQEDFSVFLRSRSEELIAGGRMVLILLGRTGHEHVDRGNSFYWELLARSFSILVSQGEVEEGKVDSYDVHFYAPSKEEIEDEVRREGCFELERVEMVETEKDYDRRHGYGAEVAMALRAVQEPMLRHHFGQEIDLDSLFEIYGRLIDEEMAKEELNPITFVLVLRKLP